jgi:hypothetical protein
MYTETRLRNFVITRRLGMEAAWTGFPFRATIADEVAAVAARRDATRAEPATIQHGERQSHSTLS